MAEPLPNDLQSEAPTGHPTPLEPPFKLPLTVVEEHSCPYLAGRKAQLRVGDATGLGGTRYAQLMDVNFRRSGSVVYQPVCRGCLECRQLRVLVNEFKHSKSDRRVLRKNSDLLLSVGRPALTLEKADLYARYVSSWHDDRSATAESVGQDLADFLYQPVADTLEMQHRTPGGRLLGIGILDVTPNGLSSVYFYFDPAERHRSVGHFAALLEIQLARSLGMDFYYLGYFVDKCRKMSYKMRYRPCEVLQADGRWQRFGAGPGGLESV